MQDRWALNGPRPADSGAGQQPVATGNYHIQVGAFPNLNDAERQARQVRTRVPHIVNRYRHLTIPVTVRGKQLWRVRFAGFASQDATRTCNELRRNNIDCFVASP